MKRILKMLIPLLRILKKTNKNYKKKQMMHKTIRMNYRKIKLSKMKSNRDQLMKLMNLNNSIVKIQMNG